MAPIRIADSEVTRSRSRACTWLMPAQTTPTTVSAIPA